jgi:hypothetical protein
MRTGDFVASSEETLTLSKDATVELTAALHSHRLTRSTVEKPIASENDLAVAVVHSRRCEEKSRKTRPFTSRFGSSDQLSEMLSEASRVEG